MNSRCVAGATLNANPAPFRSGSAKRVTPAFLLARRGTRKTPLGTTAVRFGVRRADPTEHELVAPDHATHLLRRAAQCVGLLFERASTVFALEQLEARYPIAVREAQQVVHLVTDE